MADVTFPNFAPYDYWLKQVINPWQAQVYYGPVTYQTMESSDIGLEKEIVERVASYGRQLGRISDVLGAMIDTGALPSDSLNTAQRCALEDFQSMRREIEALRWRRAGIDETGIDRLRRKLQDLKRRNDGEYERVARRLRELLD
jgi:hypothetical protein